MAALAFGVMTRTPPELLAQHFLERAYTEGGGTNVVNVILVDFRGFDTLGEITVLGAVALTIYALLRRFRPAPDSVDIPEQQRDQSAYDIARPDRREGDTVADWLLVPSILTRLLFPVIGLVALFLLLRGHDLPGGGFAAGLTASIALILQYMVGGTQWVEDRLRVQPLRWIGARAAARHRHRAGRLAVRPSLPDVLLRLRGAARHRRGSDRERPALRPRRVRARGRRHRADADRARSPVGPRPPRRAAAGRQRRGRRSQPQLRRRGVMEIILALAIGVLAGSGVWLLLRPRTFQVIIGLSLLSYAVNLFIFSTGGLRTGVPPVLETRRGGRPRPVRRPGAAGAGPHRHRHRLRHDRAVPRACCSPRAA